MLVVYIGSLAALVLTSLYSLQSDPTGLITQLDTSLGLDNFRRLFDEPVYREVSIRTFTAAITVTVVDAVIALPVAFFMAKVASRWARRALVVTVTMPLWAGYLVKGYAWRAILDPGGGVLVSVFGRTPGFGYTSVGHRALLPVVPVHGHPDLRRARPAPELVARSVDGSRREGGPDVRAASCCRRCTPR